MMALLRILVVLMAMTAIYFIASLFIYFFLPFIEKVWIYNTISFLTAVISGRFMWRTLQPPLDSIDKCVTIGAIGLGSLGFCAGYLGPIIFTPGANQGPLLGIFFTGPLGFVLGMVGGWVYWQAIGKKRSDNEEA